MTQHVLNFELKLVCPVGKIRILLSIMACLKQHVDDAEKDRNDKDCL